jgi:hypothetical protein
MCRKDVIALLVFLGFSVSLAGRDVARELYLGPSPDSVSFAFWLCATAALLSALWSLARREALPVLRAGSRSKVLVASLSLSLMCALIYVSTFLVVDAVGAGFFNLFDWGLASLLTASIGVLWDKDPPPRGRLWAAVALFAGGFVALCTVNRPLWGPLLAVATLSPVCTALSFPIQRWLLSKDGGGLTRAQVTFVRFAPAAACILLFRMRYEQEPLQVGRAGRLALVALLGYVPLVLLCYAVVIDSMARFAVWLVAIPALAFFGTLHAHPEHQAPAPIAGACLMLLAVLVMEVKPSPKTGTSDSVAATEDG